MTLSVVMFAELDNLKNLAPLRLTTAAPRPHNDLAWKTSPVGLVKSNVDGAVSRSGTTGITAAFSRDDQGMYLGASALV